MKRTMARRFLGVGVQALACLVRSLKAGLQRKALRTSILVLSIGPLVSLAFAKERSLSNLEVFPEDVKLSTQRDRQGLVIQATYDDGITEDVTSSAKYSFADPKLIRFEDGTIFPLADGSTKLTIEFGGKTLTVPILVEDADKERPVSFSLDVMPVFMKAGCNSGSCHGAARGKDGFRLSLFGFDVKGDHFRLAREMNGRRINLAVPEESLMIQKPLGRVPHTGGKRFDAESVLCESLLRWLKAGAPNDPEGTATPIGMEVLPKQAVLNGKGSTQRLTVRVKYSDGTDRDVTSLALFSSNNEQSAAISEDGVVTAGNRGEAFIIARFATFNVGSQFVVLPKDLDFTFLEVPEYNYVDTHVYHKLRKLRITPSEVCSDEAFLRRASIDIIGMLPTREEYERFLANEDAKKRESLVDELLGRKEFVELWVMKFAELLQIRSVNNRFSYKSVLRYYDWLKDRIANEVPMNVIVQELLGSTGGTFEKPATNYYQIERNTLKTAENVAQVFMGMRIQCAQCHNHPFDRWTQDDYYSFAAFFAQIGRKRGEDPRETIIFNSASGDVRHVVGNRVMAPKFLGGDVPDVKGKDRRVVLAQWLASPENPYFAKNLANIVWAHFFGMGIIQEVDDVRVSNPASNPELLDALAQQFTEYDYDFKKLVRDICTSRTYQLSTQRNDSNEKDEKNFSHGRIRRLRAEVLLDCVAQVTGTKNKFRGLPSGARAVQIADGRVSNYFLTTFGRATRATVCSCEVTMEPNLSQAFHLLNGDTVASAIPKGGCIEQMFAEKQTPNQIVEDLYIRCFSRKLSEEEWAKFQPIIEKAPKKRPVLEDIFWALLNSKEFLFNH